MSSKVAVLIPYFGEKFPIYFPLFLNSVSYNLEYDFLCFTNINYTGPIPDNFKLINFSLQEFKKLVETKTGINLQIDNPYKLCDLKPCYGLIFQDYLKEVDFWGHTDIDLVFGKLDHFIDRKDLLNKFDIISFRDEWLSGSFALYKNSNAVNRLFMNSKDWEKVYSTPNYIGFDECSKSKEEGVSIFKALMNGADLRDLSTEIESFTEVLLKTDLKVHFKTVIKESIAKGMILRFHNGVIEIFRSGNSKITNGFCFLHYHYITEKKGRYFKYPKWSSIPKTYLISRFGFHQNLFDYYLRYVIVKIDIAKHKFFNIFKND